MVIEFDFDALEKWEEEASKPKETCGNILIIDDEPENLYALERLLSREFTVFSTTDPHEALSWVNTERIDVIISDQRMPVMLGTEFLKKVKEKNDDNVRMILTGYTDVKDLIECINAGLIYRYVVKPFNSEEIKVVVRQAMDVIASKRIVDRMLPTQIVNRLYPEGIRDVKEGFGKEVECAIMFLDIRGFTSLAESMGAEDAFKLLTSFIKSVGPIVTENHGFIDKYLGDGLLAIFDRENEFSNDVLNCIEMTGREIARYNEANRSAPVPDFRPSEQQRELLRYGIGVSYGHVILGTVGFREKIDFTVLGDAVNTASRIESLTKELGSDILVHSEVLEHATNPLPEHRIVGEIQLKGKKDLIPITEILSSVSEGAKSSKLLVAQELRSGVKALNESAHASATEILENALEKSPDDKALQYFLRLAEGRPRTEYSRAPEDTDD